MKATGIILLLLVWHSGFSQWDDNFGDGDYQFNPSWRGTTAAYTVDNGVLRLTAPPVSSSSYLSTPSDNINNAVWKFSVQLAFNPSSSNYAKVYLVANQEDLSADLNGYFIKIGGGSDEISLYRQDGTLETEIIDGIDARVSLSNVTAEIWVTRSDLGEWDLSSKLFSESNWISEGSIIDINYTSSLYFGVSCVYTSTRSDKFYFDNFQVSGTAYVDTEGPLISKVVNQGSNGIKVSFNEPILGSSSIPQGNYLLNYLNTPESVISGDSTIILNFNESLSVINTLTITGILDLADNAIEDTVVQVIYIDPEPAAFGEITINEIMADPSPREDLPEVEFIELYNVTNKAIEMTGWSLSDKTTTFVFDDLILLPDSIIILTAFEDKAMVEAYGKVLGLSPWPSLNNSGDSITLLNDIGEVIDNVVYDISWYQDSEKNSGGWSLEKRSPRHPCSGYLNWQASIHPNGGTPGEANSLIYESDTQPPGLLSYTYNQREVRLVFNEPVVESNLEIILNSGLDADSLSINYNQMYLSFAQDFVTEEYNLLRITDLEDCYGNRALVIEISFIPDFSPPQIDTVYSEYPNILEVFFNEAVYNLDPAQIFLDGVGQPKSIVQNSNEKEHLSLEFDNGLISGTEYVLKIDTLTDTFNNMTEQSYYIFSYNPLAYPRFGELLITEIMADPTPIINLPNNEYIELFNTTSRRLLIKGLTLADEKDKTVLPSGIIEPFDRVILTKSSAVDELSHFGETIGVPNWLSLNNSDDKLSIVDPEQNIIHNVSYSSSWYGDQEKEEGGWSLELIDMNNFCGGIEVWQASLNLLGGTPGEPNSIESTVEDLVSPAILKSYTISTDTIEIQLSEPLNNIRPLVSINDKQIQNHFFRSHERQKVVIPTERLIPRNIYTVTLSNFSDCIGNLNKEEQARVLLPEEATTGDILVSEILFNPNTDGADFIEVYNNSAKNISLSNWIISNGTSKSIIPSNDLLKPYSYRVLTSSPVLVIEEYPKAVYENIYPMSLPVLPNTSGRVVIRNEEGVLLDSIDYTEEWHFSYLANVDGVSLERRNFNGASSEANKWASASSLENYATPGYRNSQAGINESSATIAIYPQVIVPDGDGRDDFTSIEINGHSSGALATIAVYNLQGQLVKPIANNLLISSTSGFRWDGTNGTGSVVSLGHYIIKIEVILDNGNTKSYREKVVVAKGF